MSHAITATPEATLTIKQMAAQSGMSEYKNHTYLYFEKGQAHANTFRNPRHPCRIAGESLCLF
jgi:hypothetical protein